jgi:hypothetical protein
MALLQRRVLLGRISEQLGIIKCFLLTVSSPSSSSFSTAPPTP